MRPFLLISLQLHILKTKIICRLPYTLQIRKCLHTEKLIENRLFWKRKGINGQLYFLFRIIAMIPQDCYPKIQQAQYLGQNKVKFVSVIQNKIEEEKLLIKLSSCCYFRKHKWSVIRYLLL